MKRVKILVASHNLQMVGGTETFTYTLIEELVKRKNIDVEYFTFNKGFISQKIEEDLGVHYMANSKYDLILANHKTCVAKLHKFGFIVQTCHGIYPKLEQPSVFADAHVAISQEVQDHLINLGFGSKIIWNGINLNRFTLKKSLNKKLNTVLSLCHSEEANSFIKRICDQLNINFLQAFKYKDPIWNIEDRINEADLVIGLGRSAYEAMACGRPVVVYDNRRYFKSCGDGYVKDVLGFSLQNNCSGRFFRNNYTLQDLVREFQKYDAKDSSFFMKFAERELDISKNVDKYLAHWQNCVKFRKAEKRRKIKNLIEKLTGRLGVRMALKLEKIKNG